MIAYAEREFRLNLPQKDGRPLRQHIEAVMRVTHRWPEGAEPRLLPEGAAYLWEWFCEISGRRQGGMGPLALSWTDIEAWARLRSISLSAFEIDCFNALERAYWRVQREAQ